MPVPDSTKALLALVVPLAVALALGAALLISFGRTSEGAPVYGRAPAPGTVGAGPSSPSAGCAEQQHLTSPSRAGAELVVVSPAPTSVTARWLPGLDPTDCRAITTHGGRALSVDLATALDEEPAVAPGIHMCPLDDGSSVALYFAYRQGQTSEVVTVALSGCRFISDPGRTSRWWLLPGPVGPRFAELLATLAPAPWRSIILAAIQAG